MPARTHTEAHTHTHTHTHTHIQRPSTNPKPHPERRVIAKHFYCAKTLPHLIKLENSLQPPPKMFAQLTNYYCAQYTNRQSKSQYSKNKISKWNKSSIIKYQYEIGSSTIRSFTKSDFGWVYVITSECNAVLWILINIWWSWCLI